MYLNSPLKSKGQAKASPNYGAVAIRGPDVDGLDSPKAIIRGSYVEIRAFEIAYHRIRGRISPLIGRVDGRIAVKDYVPQSAAPSAL